MIGSVVVLYNPTKEEVENINTYLSSVDYAVIVDNSTHSNKKLVETLVYDEQYKKTICSTALCFTIITSLIVFFIMILARNYIAQYFFSDRQYAYDYFLLGTL